MSLESDVIQKLGKLPENLKQTYDIIYQQILAEEDNARKAAKFVIMWIVSAYRPLTPNEILSALYWSDIEDILDLEVLLRICHNLVRFDVELGVLRLTHLSVREYFEKYHFGETEGHMLIARTCFSILQFGEEGHQLFQDQDPEMSIKPYAILSWPFHIQSNQESPTLQDYLYSFLGLPGQTNKHFLAWYGLAQRLIQDSPPSERNLSKLYPVLQSIESEPLSPLPLASLFGFREYFSRISREGLLPENFTNKRGESLLMLAALHGHREIAKLLLEYGANANACIYSELANYGNALEAAAIGGHVDMVELLLAHGAKVNAVGGRFGNALQAAAYHGHRRIVEILHNNGGDTKAGRGYFGNALHAAAYAGNEDLVDFLLAAGDDVNDQAGKFGCALGAATYKGHLKMVEKLLARGADVNAKAATYGSALHIAAIWGAEKIAKLLIAKGADVNAVELSGRTPLHDTINKGHINLMELLLANGTDPRVMDVNGWTALDEATWRGRQDIVEVFARHGVFAWQDPPDCPLPSKDRASLVKSALEIAFRDFQPGDNNWLEFAVPIVRFSCFYLKMLPHAQRATQEIALRWGWVCDSCRRSCDREPQLVCMTCHSIDLCTGCYALRERQELSIPTCEAEHVFSAIDLEISGPDVWTWMNQAKSDLIRAGQLDEVPKSVETITELLPTKLTKEEFALQVHEMRALLPQPC
jgi:ankyrin repeat protein